MSTVQIAHYPFDYHTHFWGILPPRCKSPSFSHAAPTATAPVPTPSLETAVAKYYGFVAGLTVDQLQAPSKGAEDLRAAIIEDAQAVSTPIGCEAAHVCLGDGQGQGRVGGLGRSIEWLFGESVLLRLSERRVFC